jgi:putative endonuclease
MAHTYYVYVLTNWTNNLMYVGRTNDLERRMFEHKKKLVKGFTQKYNINKLVYFEESQKVNAAIMREKEIKKWRRGKKDSLVNGGNPQWKDLSLEFQDSSLRSE